MDVPVRVRTGPGPPGHTRSGTDDGLCDRDTRG